MIKRIIFSFGSNLGNRKLIINKAIINLIHNLNLTNVKKSNFLENNAILPKNAPIAWNKKYLNLLLAADIDLEEFHPLTILKIIKKIEKELGRKDAERWSPRIIDIDILNIIDFTFQSKDRESHLSIPHKEINNREFIKKLMIDIL